MGAVALLADTVAGAVRDNGGVPGSAEVVRVASVGGSVPGDVVESVRSSLAGVVQVGVVTDSVLARYREVAGCVPTRPIGKDLREWLRYEVFAFRLGLLSFPRLVLFYRHVVPVLSDDVLFGTGVYGDFEVLPYGSGSNGWSALSPVVASARYHASNESCKFGFLVAVQRVVAGGLSGLFPPLQVLSAVNGVRYDVRVSSHIFSSFYSVDSYSFTSFSAGNEWLSTSLDSLSVSEISFNSGYVFDVDYLLKRYRSKVVDVVESVKSSESFTKESSPTQSSITPKSLAGSRISDVPLSSVASYQRWNSFYTAGSADFEVSAPSADRLLSVRDAGTVGVSSAGSNAGVLSLSFDVPVESLSAGDVAGLLADYEQGRGVSVSLDAVLVLLARAKALGVEVS